MQHVVIVIHLMIVLAIIGFVLLQRSEGGGLGMGSGSGAGGFMSSRGTANVLTRATGFLAIAFFCTSLLLSILAGMDRKPRSILDGTTPAPAGGAPSAPNAPLAPGGGGLLDTLRGPPAGGPPQPPGPPGPPQPQ